MNPLNHDESTPHWASQYIGLPWVAGSSDCWSFARRVWRERFSWDVAAVDVDAAYRLQSLKAFDAHPEYANWQVVTHPQEGDACLMGKSERPSHIGIYLEADSGGVLHSLESVRGQLGLDPGGGNLSQQLRGHGALWRANPDPGAWRGHDRRALGGAVLWQQCRLHVGQ